MKTKRMEPALSLSVFNLGGAALTALSPFLFLGCELGNSQAVDVGNTIALIESEATSTTPDGSKVVCNPFTKPDHPNAGVAHGVIANLTYLDDQQPRYSSAMDYQTYGHPLDATLFFGNLDIPTRPFDSGFVNRNGETLVNDHGNTLYEYFSLRFQSVLQLDSHHGPGDYQFGILADDGAVVEVDRGNGWETLIDNDGVHATKFACASQPVSFGANTRVPIRVTYYQGPRYHIALVLLWRAWDAATANDVECGRSGNSRYFNSTHVPPTPQTAYQNMMIRGWRAVGYDNFTLPDQVAQNPCNQGVPVTTSITGVDPSGSVTNVSNVAFQFSSNTTGANFECALDNSAAVSCVSPTAYGGMADGTHTFVVRASANGKTDAVGASHTWTQDTVSPNLVLSSVSSTSASFTVTWTTTEPSTTRLSWGVGSSTANVVPDDGVFSTQHSVTVNGLQPDSVYSYVISGRDLANNAFAIARRVVLTAE